MRIEELVLEGDPTVDSLWIYADSRTGFKSYPVRTQITGWDPFFNAITSLNGSGKSNILDAICFVLGITNMAQVRSIHDSALSCANDACFGCRCAHGISRILSTNEGKLSSPKPA
jgi:hypothetical protein